MPFVGTFPRRDPESVHWTVMNTADGQTAFTLTGIIVTEFKGVGNQWERGRLEFPVSIQPLAPGKGLVLRHWAPFVTINSISNDDISKDAGWAVDGFSLADPEKFAVAGVTVRCDLAVRDVDGFIFRIGYHLHLVGTLADLPRR